MNKTQRDAFMKAADEEEGCFIAAGLLPHQHALLKKERFLLAALVEEGMSISAGVLFRETPELQSPVTRSYSPIQAIQRLRETLPLEGIGEFVEQFANSARLSVKTRLAMIDALFVVIKNMRSSYPTTPDDYDAHFTWIRIANELLLSEPREQRLRRWFSLLEMLSPAAFRVLMWCPDMRAIAESRESLAGSAS